MIIPCAPSTNHNTINNVLPPDTEVIDQQIYYVVNTSGIKIYDINNNFYGISNGFSRIAHTATPTFSGAICINYNGNNQWIQGEVKNLYDSNCILYDVKFC